MILAVHCDCMAGLGESCSHAACLMWAVEAGAKRRSSLTVTDKKAYWVLPGPLRKVEPVRVKEMKFSDNPRPSPSSLHHRSIEPPSEESVSKFMEAMSKGRTRPAVLSLVHPYSDEYIPKSLDGSLPKLLTELFDKAHLQATLNELVVMAEGAMTSYKCTMSEVQAAEEATKDQANSKVWFQLRAGRVTASNLKAVCSTKPEKPSVSLVMTICYPELKKFRSSATTWGCKHEVTGRKVYNNIQSQNHDGFSLSASGLHISLEEGFMAASPDGLVTCNCCGDGICEIKVIVRIYLQHLLTQNSECFPCVQFSALTRYMFRKPDVALLSVWCSQTQFVFCDQKKSPPPLEICCMHNGRFLIRPSN